jgi:hypothetical protein
MKKVEIQIPEFLKGKLVKDLQDDEVVCEHCKGTGLRIEDNNYGIQGERSRNPFPYTHQSISFCQYCYNGIQHKCSFCGKVLERGSYECNCEGYKKEQLNKEIIKYNESIAKAEKIKFADYEGLFLDDERAIDKETFADNLYYKIRSGEDYPNVVFGTEKEPVMSIDFNDIISSACEDDGYEDMSECLDYDGVEEIQTLIDKWVDKQGDSNYCYYETGKIAVLLDDLIAEIKEQIKTAIK